MSSGRRGAAIGYGLSVLISALVTLVSIPVIVTRASADAWASLTLGQAVGTGAALLIGFGWGATGPALVARAGTNERVDIYASSLRARMLLVPFVAGAAAIVIVVGASAEPVASVLNGLGYALTGLLAGWFFTGLGRPYLFLLLDALPRVAGAAVGTVVVLVGAPLIWYGIAQLGGIVIGVLISNRIVLRQRRGRKALPRPGITSTLRVLREQLHGFVLAAVLAANAAVPAAAVSILAPGALPTFALADKLLRFGTTAYSPVVQYLQGWVPADPRQTAGRSWKATVRGAFLSIVGAIAFVLLARPVGHLLGQDEVALPWDVVLLFGAILFVLEAGQFIGLVALQSLGYARKLSRFALIGVSVLCPAVVIGSALDGARGAALGVLVGEIVGVVPLIILIARHRPSSSAREPATGA